MKIGALVLLLALLVGGRCVAGTTGVLDGYVRDANGRPAADVLVVAASPSAFARTYADKRGFFVFLNLPPDVYIISAERTETASANELGVQVNSDQTTSIALRFSTNRRCFSFTRPTLSSDERSEPFTSFDVDRMQQYPPNAAPPIPVLPIFLNAKVPKCV